MPEAGEIQTITTRLSMTTKAEILEKERRDASNAVETILLKNAKNPMFVECVVKKATCPRSVQGLRLIPLQRKMARNKKFIFRKKWPMMIFSNKESLLGLTLTSLTKSRSSAVATMLLRPLPLLKVWVFDNC